jgi:hypothetical protein
LRQSIETYNLRARYGIDAKEKNDMLAKQNNLCAICYKPFKNKKQTHVDHCHTTNKLRGILCHHCNTGLGKFNDDPKMLQRAIYYIEYHAKQNQPTQLPIEGNRESQDNSTHGPVHGTWPWEDSYGAHHYIGEPEGYHTNSGTEEGGGVSLGTGV